MKTLEEELGITPKVEKKKQLCSIKIDRDENGLKMFVKSPLFEDFFKNTSKGVTKIGSVKWGAGLNYYSIERFVCPKGDYHFTIHTNDLANYEVIDTPQGVLDFSFIKAVGIGEGIEIPCNGLYMQNDIDTFVKDFSTFMRSFVSSYMKKAKTEITISQIL
jgi:hypothetical protein